MRRAGAARGAARIRRVLLSVSAVSLDHAADAAPASSTGCRSLIRDGHRRRSASGHVAFIQFLGSTFLSAILDNNVVADFASRALTGSTHVLHLFAMAQIAGYALGGCWTHIGCAQSVVAYAFIQRDVDEHYTPVQWIREMTPVIVEILVLISVLIWAESRLLTWLG